VTISAAGVFTVSGAVMFRAHAERPGQCRYAAGRGNDLDSGQLRRPPGSLRHLSGAARFHFGGPEGFQLEDIRVSGYSIFGQGATIAAPASSLRAPTADLANPASMAIVSINDLTYLAVTYQDPNRVGLNDGVDPGCRRRVQLVTVSDHGRHAITGLTVKNGSVQKSVDATNDRTFLYQLDDRQPSRMRGAECRRTKGVTVSVTFVDATWSDERGANGAAEVERFTLYTPAPATAAPSLKPYATLASPANGATASLHDPERPALSGRHLLQPDRRRASTPAASMATNSGSPAPVPPTWHATPTAPSWRRCSMSAATPTATC
jgi:hypothetical protein